MDEKTGSRADSASVSGGHGSAPSPMRTAKPRPGAGQALDLLEVPVGGPLTDASPGRGQAREGDSFRLEADEVGHGTDSVARWTQSQPSQAAMGASGTRSAARRAGRRRDRAEARSRSAARKAASSDLRSRPDLQPAEAEAMHAAEAGGEASCVSLLYERMGPFHHFQSPGAAEESPDWKVLSGCFWADRRRTDVVLTWFRGACRAAAPPLVEVDAFSVKSRRFRTLKLGPESLRALGNGASSDAALVLETMCSAAEADSAPSAALASSAASSRLHRSSASPDRPPAKALESTRAGPPSGGAPHAASSWGCSQTEWRQRAQLHSEPSLAGMEVWWTGASRSGEPRVQFLKATSPPLTPSNRVSLEARRLTRLKLVAVPASLPRPQGRTSGTAVASCIVVPRGNPRQQAALAGHRVHFELRTVNLLSKTEATSSASLAAAASLARGGGVLQQLAAWLALNLEALLLSDADLRVVCAVFAAVDKPPPDAIAPASGSCTGHEAEAAAPPAAGSRPGTAPATGPHGSLPGAGGGSPALLRPPGTESHASPAALLQKENERLRQRVAELEAEASVLRRQVELAMCQQLASVPPSRRGGFQPALAQATAVRGGPSGTATTSLPPVGKARSPA